MLKNICKFEFTVEGRSYSFLCDQDSPTNHIKEVLFQLLRIVGSIEDSVKAQQAEAEKPQEPPKTE